MNIIVVLLWVIMIVCLVLLLPILMGVVLFGSYLTLLFLYGLFYLPCLFIKTIMCGIQKIIEKVYLND